MDVKLKNGINAKLIKKSLKNFQKKSDLKGLQHVSVFFGLLLITGILAYQTWEHGGQYLVFNLWKYLGMQ